MNNKFEGLISLGEAAELFDISERGLRKAIERGKLKEGQDAKKFGKQWVIDIAALKREYGKKITKNQCYQIAKEFCDLETCYSMGIVLNENKGLEIKPIDFEYTDEIEDRVLYDHDTFNNPLNKSKLAEYLYNKIKEM